ncbi:MAG: hypothetical protein GY791_14135 [Alphaproteobacteria bacterium]|nr:hypothetical protein [Alphaproteobacteria bacterium]
MYNWYDGRSDVKRKEMPFFVMYELSDASVGSALCWRGVVFWPGAGGGFDRLANGAWDCRAITAADAGRQVYGIAVSYDPPLAMRLDPSTALWSSAVVEDLTKAVAVLCIVLLIFDLRIAGERRRTAMVVGVGAGLVVTLELLGGNAIGGWWPYSGGNDGLTHEGYGHIVLDAAVRGDWREALRGNETVYWHMPGLRYVRALGSVFFGDTSFGFLTIVLAVPAAFYLLFRTVLPVRMALIMAAIFLVFPISSPFGFSFLSYIDLFQRGLGEAIAYAAFLFALVIYLNAAGRDFDGILRSALWANALLALALFIRPNLGPGTIVFLVGYFLFIAARAKGKPHRRGTRLPAIGVGPVS